MTHDPVRYVGFSVAAGAREYRFEVQANDPEKTVRSFTLSVNASYFSPGKLRFQQGPDITSRKLRVMIAAEAAEGPVSPSQMLSDSDIAEYASGVPASNKMWNQEQKGLLKVRAGTRPASKAVTLVFEYGPDCLDSQMNGRSRLSGDAKCVGIAETVDDYEIVFDVWSEKRSCATSDLLRSVTKHTENSKVWGVLYEVPDWLIERASAEANGRKSLDAIKGAGTEYQRTAIEVRKPGGQPIQAITYTAANPKAGLLTQTGYVRHIVTGLRERGVPEGYIDRVKSIACANNPAMSAIVPRL
jgi:hypothetical protein